MTAIPTLDTQRLTLRAWQIADVEPLAALYSTEPDASMRYVGGPATVEDAWRIICVRMGHWALRGHGPFAIVSKADQQLVGWCGTLHHVETAEPELHYAVRQDARRRGVGHEALERVLSFLADEFRWRSVPAYIAADNIASRGLVVRLGADKTMETVRSGVPTEVWRFALPRGSA